MLTAIASAVGAFVVAGGVVAWRSGSWRSGYTLARNFKTRVDCSAIEILQRTEIVDHFRIIAVIQHAQKAYL